MNDEQVVRNLGDMMLISLDDTTADLAFLPKRQLMIKLVDILVVWTFLHGHPTKDNVLSLIEWIKDDYKKGLENA